jgi:tRNA-splicing ligase RtcB (3'-phosphate/5'-hydroxy nucleic acid ligase)
MSGEIKGKTLIEWGYEPGRWFSQAIEAAENARKSGQDESEIRAIIDAFVPPPAIPLRDRGDLDHHINIRAENPDETENVAAVLEHMKELMRVPTITASAVMPDACPSGSAPGTIPVGGVIAAMH